MKLSFLLLPFLLLAGCSDRSPVPASINISVPYEVDSLDPHSRDTISNFAVAANFYEPLVRTDHLQKIRPALAVSWENPDLHTWIFHLRRGVRFHNGKTMDSQDVVYSIERLLKDQTLQMRAYIASIASVSAPDSHKVIIRTHWPTSVFLQKLNFILIVPHGLRSDQLQSAVNGTGPYKLKQWKVGQEVVMERNAQYWNGLAALPKVVFSLNRTPRQAIDDLLSFRSQLVQSNSKELETAIGPSAQWQILIHDSLFIKYLGFDFVREETPYARVKQNPFRSKEVRQAIGLAIDRQGVVSQLSTFAVPATQPVPPFIFGYNPEIPVQKADPGEAKKLLAQAGYPDGFEVTLDVRKILDQTGELVKKQLASVGIRVKLRVLSDSDWFAAVDNKDSSFFLSRLGCPTGDASDVLDMAFHSYDPSRRYGARNYGGYRNSDVDAAIEASSTTVNMERRRRLLQQIMLSLTEDVAWVPLYFDQEVYALDRRFSWTPRNDSYILAGEITLR